MFFKEIKYIFAFILVLGLLGRMVSCYMLEAPVVQIDMDRVGMHRLILSGLLFEAILNKYFIYQGH